MIDPTSDFLILEATLTILTDQLQTYIKTKSKKVQKPPSIYAFLQTTNPINELEKITRIINEFQGLKRTRWEKPFSSLEANWQKVRKINLMNPPGVFLILIQNIQRLSQELTQQIQTWRFS